MGIITISRGSFTKGEEIAERLADKLGYKCISREILLEATKEFNIPEVKLSHAIEDAPSIFDRLMGGKKEYVDFIRLAFLEHIQQDNVVYHGFAGHFFTYDIPNIFKVRIIANIEFRLKIIMERENLSEDEARIFLNNLDSQRRKWSNYLYGIDTDSTKLYDILLRIDCLKAETAVQILYKLSKRPCFQTTPESKKRLRKMLITAKNDLNVPI